MNDWKGFISTKFLPCPGIANWHVVKIPQLGNHIYVADHVGDNLRQVIIMNENVSLTSIPSKIIPVGLSEARKKELEFFKEFVVDEHVHFIADEY